MADKNMSLEDMNATLELITQMDLTEFDLLDQLAVCGSFARCLAEIKPIYAKYAAKDPSITNFIMKL